MSTILAIAMTLFQAEAAAPEPEQQIALAIMLGCTDHAVPNVEITGLNLTAGQSAAACECLWNSITPAQQSIAEDAYTNPSAFEWNSPEGQELHVAWDRKTCLGLDW